MELGAQWRDDLETAAHPAGVRLLVPGWPQWSWRQGERAAVLLGWYLAALVVGLFAWGTAVGTIVLAFAFGTHVLSAADALRQAAFPPLGRWVPWISAATGLGLGYGPLAAVLCLVAWPVQHGGSAYLVNRWSLRVVEPEPGQWLCYREPGAAEPGVGRLWAKAGQELSWRDGMLRVDEQPADWLPTAGWRRVGELALTVPPGHVLVEPVEPRTGRLGLVLVEQSRILGRVWAQSRPILARRLLP